MKATKTPQFLALSREQGQSLIDSADEFLTVKTAHDQAMLSDLGKVVLNETLTDSAKLEEFKRIVGGWAAANNDLVIHLNAVWEAISQQPLVNPSHLN